MSSSFKFHSAVPEIIPWQAQYQFPSQSNKVRKQTVKLVPKNGSSFGPTQIVRFEFPADGYCNMLNTALTFDVKTDLSTCGATAGSAAVAADNLPYIQLPRGGAHNYIKRVRVLYGSLVLEDIQEYKTLARMFTEMGVSKAYQQSTGSIADGHSESAMRNVANPFAPNSAGANVNKNAYLTDAVTTSDALMMSNSLVNASAVMAQQVGGSLAVLSGNTNGTVYYPRFDFCNDASTSAAGPNTSVTRTFTLQLLTGLTSLKKLLPLKWMASQIAIELTMASTVEMYNTNLLNPTVSFLNMNMITELLEFDSSYDLAFFEGLKQDTGVPIKFTSWHYHQFSVTGATQTVQIHERSRSVKAAFAIIRMANPIQSFDADFFFHNIQDTITAAPITNGYTGVNINTFTRGNVTTQAALGGAGGAYSKSTLAGTELICCPVQQYQWRIGGQYYPAQPVRVTSTIGPSLTATGALIARGEEAYLELMKAVNCLGDPTVSGGIHHWNYTITGTSGINGEGSKFIMGASFETPGLGPESVNGINAEEQSDLALTISSGLGTPVSTSGGSKKLEVFVNFDCLLLIRAGNVVDLVL